MPLKIECVLAPGSGSTAPEFGLLVKSLPSFIDRTQITYLPCACLAFLAWRAGEMVKLVSREVMIR
jgi:hypothetical protein